MLPLAGTRQERLGLRAVVARLVHSTSPASAARRARVAGGAEEPLLARRVPSSKRRRHAAYAAPHRRRTRCTIPAALPSPDIAEAVGDLGGMLPTVAIMESDGLRSSRPERSVVGKPNPQVWACAFKPSRELRTSLVGSHGPPPAFSWRRRASLPFRRTIARASMIAISASEALEFRRAPVAWSVIGRTLLMPENPEAERWPAAATRDPRSMVRAARATPGPRGPKRISRAGRHEADVSARLS